MKKLLTLCMVYEKPRLLLGLKKRGLGVGKWAGFGGKVDKGESIEEAAARELKEEAGIEMIGMEKCAVVEFDFKGEDLEMHVFRSIGFKGTPQETEEMAPRWFDINDLPFDAMWGDYKYWMPLFMSGKKFRAKFVYDESEKIVSHSVDVVDGW